VRGADRAQRTASVLETDGAASRAALARAAHMATQAGLKADELERQLGLARESARAADDRAALRVAEATGVCEELAKQRGSQRCRICAGAHPCHMSLGLGSPMPTSSLGLGSPLPCHTHLDFAGLREMAELEREECEARARQLEEQARQLSRRPSPCRDDVARPCLNAIGAAAAADWSC
jgi:hypothetical protein